MSLDCSPMFNYGQRAGDVDLQRRRATTTRSPSRASMRRSLRLTTDLRLGFEGNRAMARTLMKEGQTHFVALSWSEYEPPHTHEDAYKRLVWTAHHWQHWLARGRFPDHPWRIHLERSALTLKGLTFAPTGALVAAATTSLPETVGGERNWDYRYTWIRDSTLTLWAMARLGFDWEADDFFSFIADVAGVGDESRSCTASAVSGSSRSGSSTTSTATRAHAPCASATGRSTRSSTTSGARSSTRCGCTRAPATGWTTGSGRSSPGSSTRPSRTGPSPTAASGRSAGSRSTSPRRR